MHKFVLFGALFVVSMECAAQVPSPPPPPGQDMVRYNLVAALEKKNIHLYSSLLKDNLKVEIDGKVVARNKNEWVAIFSPKLLAKGVLFKIISGYYSGDRILFIQYFNSVASFGGNVPAHCCWSYDAAAYDIDVSGKISSINILSGGEKKVDNLQSAR